MTASNPMIVTCDHDFDQRKRLRLHEQIRGACKIAGSSVFKDIKQTVAG